jgi:hypothetical protein
MVSKAVERLSMSSPKPNRTVVGSMPTRLPALLV